MDVVGGYELLTRVATGRSGTVWKARDPALGRQVAIKQIPLQAGAPVVRLRAEARLLAGLSHPNVIEVIGLVEERSHAWLVQEWVEGAALPAVLATAGRLSPQQAIGVVRGTLAGLAYAHAQAIVHGDVCPANVLLDASGTAKLVDFGLAPASGVPGISGTPGYLSPESARGRPVSPRGDVYSAAALLASLLLGGPVFPGRTAAEIVAQQVRVPAPYLASVEAHLRALLEQAMAADEYDRFADADQFRQALDLAAERGYGPHWHTEASVAGVVAATAPRPIPAANAALDSAMSATPAAPAASKGSQVAVRTGAGPHHASRPGDDIDRVRAPRPDPATPRHDAPTPRPLAPTNVANAIVKGFRVPGRLSATGAAVVVVAAISILVVMHATGTTTDAQTASDATSAITFRGTYSVAEKLQGNGTGPNTGQNAGDAQPTAAWTVRPTCTSAGVCTARVTPQSGPPFTLRLTGGSWLGNQPLIAGCTAGEASMELNLADPDPKDSGNSIVGVGYPTYLKCGSNTTDGSEVLSVTATRLSK
jgi:protein kinase-like protein